MSELPIKQAMTDIHGCHRPGRMGKRKEREPSSSPPSPTAAGGAPKGLGFFNGFSRVI